VSTSRAVLDGSVARSPTESMNTREKVATTASGIIILSAIVYWIWQIFGVMEQLRLAAGG